MKKKIFAIMAALAVAATTLTTTAFAAESQAATEQSGNNNWWIMLIVYAAVIAGAYFLLFRPQSKKKKKEAALRKNAQIGDEVTTIGGISGRIIAIKEESDTLVLETGTERNKINIKRWAISTVDSQTAPQAEAAATETKEPKKFFGKKKDDEAGENNAK